MLSHFKVQVQQKRVHMYLHHVPCAFQVISVDRSNMYKRCNIQLGYSIRYFLEPYTLNDRIRDI